MQIVTVTNNVNDRNFINYLQASCETNQLELIVLEYDDTFFSNRLKDLLLYEYLKEVADDELILFTDAIDTALLSNKTEILDKFSRFNAALVFSAEINCWPDRSLEANYPVADVHFKYLNSGGFIGRAGFIKSIYERYPIFETAIDQYEWSNQYYWNHIFLHEFNSIRLDHDCDIFYNTSMWVENRNLLIQQLKYQEEIEYLYRQEKQRLDGEIVFTDGRIQNNITGSLPCHIHFPGPISKLLVDRGYFSQLSMRSTT